MIRAEYSERGPALHALLHLIERDTPVPRAGQALVEMLAAPINPSDLLTITGQYGLLPALPAVAGNEAVGEIVAVGEGVSRIRIGERVVMPPGYGTWASHMLAPADQLWSVPTDADLLQLAMVRVNPPTAELLLRDFVALEAGDWIIQNAANSGVGEYVIQLARRRGVRTVNVVRREALIAPLLQMGADVVLLDGPDLPERVVDATQRAKIRLGFDAVGGSATERIASSLVPTGTVVNYGASGGESSRVTPRSLIFRDITVRGFWLVNWFRRTTPAEQQVVYDGLVGMIQRGELAARVQATYPLAQLHEAVTAAAQAQRNGKVLLVR
ncbi:MAG TPA: alcohol dehydrogenase [Gemmatimonas aurantiaca]|uniref:enoyl-[acyl-carrier-protein] reductase n=2 Tax=Gemmatimonas aurantiaca TaxID=173480 RepID=C1ABM4_GEMAT|nr:zinc-dependent alcohol dehydrogenase family protein [Gemmatimonas aurantiaca]BAH39901.1 putative oxidoreductase [Gemmatimonas aurantiaca T-27]HCT58088.1 alcohol dehydrogenase [Gemmatimonas aurantiaca]